MKLLFSTLALLTTTLATPIFANTTQSFKLKSRVLTPHNPAFECLYLEPYHIYPPFNYAVLAPKTTENPGLIGSLNGTAKELANDEGDLLFDFGSMEPPYGFVIDSINATYNPIAITPGNGTQGIFIDQGFIKYHDPMSGGFYACNDTLVYGPAVQVFYKSKVMTTPAGCSDVELVVEYV